ncbi:neutral zinc metallopeptidase [Nonomuraea sp. NPDC049158]|uniref:neutral zinc metallopeptidase n=1 Tax=Nonomuraea sp. NPDC049158 TaxID=3155649 RepID=UPI0033C37858
MKISVLAAVAAVPILLFTGTAEAAAFPVKDAPDLTNNKLYKAGKLAKPKCAKLVKGTTRASVEKYLSGLVGCMNTAWAGKLKRPAFDFDYQEATIEVESTFAERVCGSWGKAKGSAVLYCYRKLQVQLKSDWVKNASDLPILAEMSREFSLHVMGHVDINEAFSNLKSESNAENREQYRRYALQSDCLGGVFLKSIWAGQGRTAKDWKQLLAYIEGSLKVAGPQNAWYGKASSRSYWFDQGFSQADPASCNTWKAPSAKVV